MNSIFLPVQFTPFPPGYCFTTYTAFGSDIASNLRVELPGNITPINYGPNQPASNLRDRPWMVTDAETQAPVAGMGMATWSPTYGKWVVPHQIPASSSVRMDWTASLSVLETFDGGSPGTVSPTTGPFWEVDTDWADKVPIGVGAVIAAVSTNQDVFDDAAPGTPQLRAVYKIKRTARIFRTYA